MSDDAPYRGVAEPLPIAVDPVVDDAARALLHMVAIGRIDRAKLDERLSALLPDDRIGPAAEAAAALGVVRELYAFQQRVTAEGTATYYRVRFASEIWTWVISIDGSGRVNGFSLRKTPHFKIYNVWLRDVAY